MASDVPVSVTARSVEFGNISLATWIEHPVTSRISLIFDPPLPFAMRKFKIREEEREEGKWENPFYNADTKIPLNHLRNNGLVCLCMCVCVFAAPKNERWNRFEIFIFFFFCCFHFFHLIPLLLLTIIVNGNFSFFSFSETIRGSEWEREEISVYSW